MLGFSNNSLSPSRHIFYDLNTTPNFQWSKILNGGVKSRKSAKIEGKKNFTWLIFLTSNNLEPKKKKASRFGRRASSLKKSTKNTHVCEKLLTFHVGTNNQLPIAFIPPKNSSGQEKIGASQWNMISYGLSKVKIT